MSHSRERAEKICLNCHAVLAGRYCHICGQENIEPKQSFWVLVSHFFEDITHFDGKFFKTVGLLAGRPGFLSSEFVKGRRASYLDPVRMYVFTSALFFFVFYSKFGGEELTPRTEPAAAVPKGSMRLDSSRLELFQRSYQSLKQYDSIQAVLPREQKDGWILRQLFRKMLSQLEKYQGRDYDLWQNLKRQLIHSIPSLLFLSLPLFALYLQLINYKKRYAYTDHAVFLIHLYIFTFILLLLLFALGALRQVPYIRLLDYLKYPVLLYGLIYTIIAMKRFYHSTRIGVILKFVLFNILAAVTVMVLFAFFFILTLFQI